MLDENFLMTSLDLHQMYSFDWILVYHSNKKVVDGIWVLVLLVGHGRGDGLLGCNIGFCDDHSVSAAVGREVGRSVGPCVGNMVSWELTTDGSILRVGLIIDGRDVLVKTPVGASTSRLTNSSPSPLISYAHNPSTSVML